MIKIFRKIRQRIVLEKKPGKYIAYATGEILLVVIGILIALKINNLNENQKTEERQITYLKLLKQECTSNLEALHTSKEKLTSIIEGQSKLINLIGGNQDTLSEEHLSALLIQTYNPAIGNDYQLSVLSEMRASGELKNIVNDSIRLRLTTLEPLFNVASTQESYVNLYYKFGNQLIDKKGNRRTLLLNSNWSGRVFPNLDYDSMSNIPLLKVKEFENYTIQYSNASLSLSYGVYTMLETHLEDLIAMLNKEIKKQHI